MTQSNIDLDYVKNFRKTEASKNLPAFINARGDNQYIWVYTRSGFLQGAYYGAFLGVMQAVYYRKVRYVPIYAAGAGIAYAAFHASSAYFRNEI